MLRKAQSLIDIKLHASDGELGHVDDFYFDDLEWKARYMIVRTGSWFSQKHVMLSPSAIRDVVWDERAMYVDLTKEQIKQSPDLDVQKPVTREQEMELARHYSWPSYWLGASANATGAGVVATGAPAVGVNAMGVYPVSPTPNSAGVSEHIANDVVATGVSEPERLRHNAAYDEAAMADAELNRAAQADGLKHELHGVKEVTGYHIAASDGEIGHVEDFFISEDDWQIQYFLVDTKNWLPGRKVLMATNWVNEIMWEDERVYVKATREQVKDSPEYDPHAAIDRRYESHLYNHYGYPPYWI